MPTQLPPGRRGRLGAWNDERGFGFIRPDDGGPEVFLHISAIAEPGRRPQAGDTVVYTVERGGERKPRARSALISAGEPGQRPRRGAAPPAATGRPPLLLLLLLLALPIAGTVSLLLRTGSPIPLIVYPLLSLGSFALYRDDKARAQGGAWRRPENTLHLLDALGGWPGGFVAQQMLRHKNRKGPFLLVFWLIVALHQAIWAAWLLAGERLLALLERAT